jgi:aminopeptidase YwaD
VKICGNREFELLKKIGFVRVSGSAEEERAAGILLEELKDIGVEGKMETFEVTDAVQTMATFEVLEPYQKSYEVTCYRCAGDTPAEGLTAEFAYIEEAMDANLTGIEGKFVLLHGRLTPEIYQKLLQANIAGYMTFSGTILDKEEETDLPTPILRERLSKFGTVPTLNIRAKDAMELVRDKAAKVRITAKSASQTLTSRNVIATLPGTQYPEEIIAFGAHFDSVPFSTGVYDNGAGSVIIMELLRYFKENPPARTLQFMWYGSEEVGLLGSKAYVAAHQEELKKYRLMINVDVAGAILGKDTAMVTAEQSLADYTDFLFKQAGMAVGVKQDIYSSDSIPFADAGVPGINFCRFGAPGAAFIHDRRDVIDFLSAESLEQTTEKVLLFADKMVNAGVMPVPRTMPQNMVEKIDEYLFKEKKEK